MTLNPLIKVHLKCNKSCKCNTGNTLICDVIGKVPHYRTVLLPAPEAATSGAPTRRPRLISSLERACAFVDPGQSVNLAACKLALEQDFARLEVDVISRGIKPTPTPFFPSSATC